MILSLGIWKDHDLKSWSCVTLAWIYQISDEIKSMIWSLSIWKDHDIWIPIPIPGSFLISSNFELLPDSRPDMKMKETKAMTGAWVEWWTERSYEMSDWDWDSREIWICFDVGSALGAPPPQVFLPPDLDVDATSQISFVFPCLASMRDPTNSV